MHLIGKRVYQNDGYVYVQKSYWNVDFCDVFGRTWGYKIRGYSFSCIHPAESSFRSIYLHGVGYQGCCFHLKSNILDERRWFLVFWDCLFKSSKQTPCTFPVRFYMLCACAVFIASSKSNLCNTFVAILSYKLSRICVMLRVPSVNISRYSGVENGITSDHQGWIQKTIDLYAEDLLKGSWQLNMTYQMICRRLTQFVCFFIGMFYLLVLCSR